MEERGVVIGKGPGIARVRIERSESCEGCHGCLYSEAGKFMVTEAIDKIGALPGDVVRIDTVGAAPLKAALLLFVLPLVMLFAGYGVGSAMAQPLGIPPGSPGLDIAVAALFFFGSFGLLYLYTRRKSGARADRSTIIEILGRQQDTSG